MPASSRKVAIVTGSATGVGAATAILLAEHGCNVVINYTRSKAEAEETAASCRAKGAETIVFQADVSDDDACQAMVKAAADQWGRIDYLSTTPRPIQSLQKAYGSSTQAFLDIRGQLRGAYQMCAPSPAH